jgi:hypothetical protein
MLDEPLVRRRKPKLELARQRRTRRNCREHTTTPTRVLKLEIREKSDYHHKQDRRASNMKNKYSK